MEDVKTLNEIMKDGKDEKVIGVTQLKLKEEAIEWLKGFRSGKVWMEDNTEEQIDGIVNWIIWFFNITVEELKGAKLDSDADCLEEELKIEKENSSQL
jgi:hypothetical protein